ncbi:MAG: hypothetical protein J6I64_07195 [Lachnospiraceae bacterium]|nr:hypothetical protein [Lachnospiraceae bacterium]
MKKKNVWLVLALVLSMLSMLLAGCGKTEEEKIRELAGIWRMTAADTEDEALYLLENIELYEEEIVHVDLTSLEYAQLVEFTKDKTYRFAYDVEGTRACVEAFYRGVFASLYENRASLNAVYEQTFDELTEAEFYQFYADLYEAGDYETLIEYVTELAYDYEVLEEPWETGTYEIQGDLILCTVTGETQAESLGYEIQGYELTLTYVDGTEIYTR